MPRCCHASFVQVHIDEIDDSGDVRANLHDHTEFVLQAVGLPDHVRTAQFNHVRLCHRQAICRTNVGHLDVQFLVVCR